MKQIRRGVFETNSSSTHSITMCSESEYDAWKRGELYYSKWDEKFVTAQEYDTELTNYKNEYYSDGGDEDEILESFNDDKGFCSYDDFWDDEYLETYEETYTTKSGEKIIAFGKYGHD